MACTFLCICLNMAFLYVIFEQKRTCDERISDLDFELENYFHRQLASDMKKYEKKSDAKVKQIKNLPKVEKKTEKELTPKEEREMLQAIANEIEDSVEGHEFQAIQNAIVEETTVKAIQHKRPDFLDAYPPMDIEPFKHKKTDKIKSPPPNSPGNLGYADKDWKIPKIFLDDGDYEEYRSFDLLLEPKSLKPHSTFLLIIHSELSELLRRNTIRSTYGKVARDMNVALVFSLGRASEPLTGRQLNPHKMIKIRPLSAGCCSRSC